MGLLITDPTHPSLSFKKLINGSSFKDFYSIRVDNNYRIILYNAGSGFYDLVDVGNHDKMSKYGRSKTS